MTISKRTTKHSVARAGSEASKSPRKKGAPAAAPSEPEASDAPPSGQQLIETLPSAPAATAAPSGVGSLGDMQPMNFESDGDEEKEGGPTMTEPVLTPEDKKTVAAAAAIIKTETDALKTLEATKAPTADQLAQIRTAKQILEALKTLADASPTLTNDEKIELYLKQRRIDAGLGVVATITGSLYAMYGVLINEDFQGALNQLPTGAKNAMTSSLKKVVEKLKPILEGLSKFQEPGLQEATFDLLDAGTQLGYSLANLAEPDQQEESLKLADNIAIITGVVQKALPLVLACIATIGCCLNALANGPTHPDSKLKPADEQIGQKLLAALKAKTAARRAAIEANTREGEALYWAAQPKKLTA